MSSPTTAKNGVAPSPASSPTRPTSLRPRSATAQDDEAPPSTAPSVRDGDEDIDELLSDDEPRAVGSGYAGSAAAAGSGRRGGGDGVISASMGSAWVCCWDACREGFETQDDLVRHLHGEHIGVGKDTYSCRWAGCHRKGQKQATRHSLITHVRAHTGEKPYTCTQPGCNKTFTRSDAMNKHLRSLHGVVTESVGKAKRREGQSALTQKPLALHNAEGSRPASASPVPPGFAGMGGNESMDLQELHGEGSGLPMQRSRSNQSEWARTHTGPEDIVHGSMDLDAWQPQPLGTVSTATPVRPPGPSSNPSHSHGPPPDPSASASASATPVNADPTAHRTARTSLAPGSSARRRPSKAEQAEQADEDLMLDPDIADVLPRIRSREPFWTVSQDDGRAVRFIRERYPRRGFPPPPPTRKRKGAPAPPPRADEENENEDDSFDEDASLGFPDEPPQIGSVQEDDGAGGVVETPVYGRSRWQVKYVTAKVKLMLVEEENRMRKNELRELMEIERRMG